MPAAIYRKVRSADGTVYNFADADLSASPTYSGLGLVAAPATSNATGTPSTGTTEVRDTTIGNFQWTALATRRYRVTLSGCLMNTTVAGDIARVNIRDGGTATPSNTDTQITGTQLYMAVNGGPGQTGFYLTETFTTTAGIHTLSAFTVRANGTGVETMITVAGGNRQLYVEDIGSA